jgi:hypothetical protein
MKIGSPLLMLKERDLLGRPIPQYLEGKNPISIVCQFSSNCSIKLLPERVDWFTTCVSDVRDLSSCGNIRWKDLLVAVQLRIGHKKVKTTFCLSIFFYFNYVYIIRSLNYFLFKTEKGKIKVNQLKEWKEFFENKILLIKVYTLFPSVFILTLLLFLTPGKGIIHIIGIQK